MARSVNVQSMDNKAYLHKYVVPTLLKGKKKFQTHLPTENLLEINIYQFLILGLSEMYEVRPKSPVEWLADWLEENNPYKA